MKDFFTGQNVVMQNNIDRHQYSPGRQFPEEIRSSADNVANIVFVTTDVNIARSHSGPEVYLNEVTPAILKSQCVPLDPALWKIKEAETFFAARRELLAESFNEYIRDALPIRRL